MRKHRNALITFLLAVVLTMAPLSEAQILNEQRTFDAETLAVDHPVSIPSGVLSLLFNDSDVKQVAGANQDSPGNVPKDWFSASEVSRGPSDKKLYLVLGKGPLTGAHGTTFWLVGNDKSSGRPSVLLKITADRLEIGKKGKSGYPTITSVRLTAKSMTDDVYHFVACKYVLLHSVK